LRGELRMVVRECAVEFDPAHPGHHDVTQDRVVIGAVAELQMPDKVVR
jgi:hypothetical protein